MSKERKTQPSSTMRRKTPWIVLTAGDYWVEGHVPADLIQKLVSENPENILGIAAPGMPAGSPGMEGPSPVEYDIVAHDKSGNSFVYATRQGRIEPVFTTELH